MFKTHRDRGRVLLAVRVVHSAGLLLLLWVVLVIWICLAGLPLLKPHGWRHSLSLVGILCSYLSVVGDYLFYPWIKFQEGGVEIPANRDWRRRRFMRWDQIHRWSWDGDYLILTGANFQGGAVRIPENERLAVEQVMSTNVTRRGNSRAGIVRPLSD